MSEPEDRILEGATEVTNEKRIGGREVNPLVVTTKNNNEASEFKVDARITNTPSVAVSNDVAAHRARQAWEYKVIAFAQNVTAEQLERQMNELGAEGWEYVGVTGSLAQAFKRPR